MNHKRRRPKTSRAGCLMCKPWKAGLRKHHLGFDGRKVTDYRRDVDARQQLSER